MNSRRFAFTAGAAALLCAAGAVRADTIEAGPFSVDVTPALTIRCNGVVLFAGDRCVTLRGGLVGDKPSLVGPVEAGELVRSENVLTLIAQKGRNTLRREVMVTPAAVHLTYELRVFGATGSTHLQYELLTPVQTLEGAAYTVTAGLLRRPRKTTEGVFDFATTAPGKYMVQTALYFVLKSPRLTCALDFNPLGPWQGISNYGDNWSTSPYHDGKQVHFSMFCGSARHGATFTGKVIIRPGDTPYEAVHPNDALAYTTDFPTVLALNFSESDADARYRMCPATVAGDKPFRWQQPEDVRIVPRAAGGRLRRDFAAPARDACVGVLELDLQSGLYLLTLNAYDAEADTGPFDIAGTEGALLEGIRIARGRFWDKTVPLRVRNGRTALRFSGKWKINALALQLILRDEEDFLFERPYWNMTPAGLSRLSP